MGCRDLKSYEENYFHLPFEPIMVEYRRRVVIESLLKYKHDHILEVGCGSEPLFKYFSDYKLMTIAEPCSLFYQNANKIKNGNVTIYNDSFENINFITQDKNYDFVIISSLLHEISNSMEFLKKVNKICNSETIVHINVPNADSFHRLLAVKSKIIDNKYELSETQKHLEQASMFSIGMLKKLVLDNNFIVLDEGSYFIKPFTHIQMQSLIDQRIIDRKILDGFFKMTDLLPGWGCEIFVNIRKRNNKNV